MQSNLSEQKVGYILQHEEYFFVFMDFFVYMFVNQLSYLSQSQL